MTWRADLRPLLLSPNAALSSLSSRLGDDRHDDTSDKRDRQRPHCHRPAQGATPITHQP